MLLVWGHIKDHIAAKFFSRCFVSFSLDLSAKRQPQRIKRRGCRPNSFAFRFFRVCLLAPLAEEGVFRGAVQRRAQPLGRGQAILLQAVLFALQHGSAAAMAYALVCGLGLGWLADRTGHLWPGVLLHSANNLLVLAMG